MLVQFKIVIQKIFMSTAAGVNISSLEYSVVLLLSVSLSYHAALPRSSPASYKGSRYHRKYRQRKQRYVFNILAFCFEVYGPANLLCPMVIWEISQKYILILGILFWQFETLFAPTLLIIDNKLTHSQ